MYIVRPLPVAASHDDVLTEGQHSEAETYTKYSIIDEGSSYNVYTDVHYTMCMYNVQDVQYTHTVIHKNFNIYASTERNVHEHCTVHVVHV